jgi:hypothetical protein
MDAFDIIGMVFGFLGLLSFCLAMHLVYEVSKLKKDVEKLKTSSKKESTDGSASL